MIPISCPRSSSRSATAGDGRIGAGGGRRAGATRDDRLAADIAIAIRARGATVIPVWPATTRSWRPASARSAYGGGWRTASVGAKRTGHGSCGATAAAIIARAMPGRETSATPSARAASRRTAPADTIMSCRSCAGRAASGSARALCAASTTSMGRARAVLARDRRRSSASSPTRFCERAAALLEHVPALRLQPLEPGPQDRNPGGQPALALDQPVALPGQRGARGIAVAQQRQQHRADGAQPRPKHRIELLAAAEAREVGQRTGRLPAPLLDRPQPRHEPRHDMIEGTLVRPQRVPLSGDLGQRLLAPPVQVVNLAALLRHRAPQRLARGFAMLDALAHRVQLPELGLQPIGRDRIGRPQTRLRGIAAGRRGRQRAARRRPPRANAANGRRAAGGPARAPARPVQRRPPSNRTSDRPFHTRARSVGEAHPAVATARIDRDNARHPTLSGEDCSNLVTMPLTTMHATTHDRRRGRHHPGVRIRASPGSARAAPGRCRSPPWAHRCRG